MLVTDHRPLCKIFGHDRAIPSLAAARMQRWALILSAHQYTVQYIPGEQNNCADCLLSLPVQQQKVGATNDILAIDWLTPVVTAMDIAKATQKDPHTCKHSSVGTSWELATTCCSRI